MTMKKKKRTNHSKASNNDMLCCLLPIHFGSMSSASPKQNAALEAPVRDESDTANTDASNSTPNKSDADTASTTSSSSSWGDNLSAAWEDTIGCCLFAIDTTAAIQPQPGDCDEDYEISTERLLGLDIPLPPPTSCTFRSSCDDVSNDKTKNHNTDFDQYLVKKHATWRRHGSAICLQRWTRGWLARRHVWLEWRVEEGAALTIQRWWRHWWHDWLGTEGFDGTMFGQSSSRFHHQPQEQQSIHHTPLYRLSRRLLWKDENDDKSKLYAYLFAQRWQLQQRIQQRRAENAMLHDKDDDKVMTTTPQRRLPALCRVTRHHQQHILREEAADYVGRNKKYPWLDLLLHDLDHNDMRTTAPDDDKTRILLGALRHATMMTTTTSTSRSSSPNASFQHHHHDDDGAVEDYIHHNNAVFAIQMELRMVDMLVSQYDNEPQEEEDEYECKEQQQEQQDHPHDEPNQEPAAQVGKQQDHDQQQQPLLFKDDDEDHHAIVLVFDD